MLSRPVSAATLIELAEVSQTGNFPDSGNMAAVQVVRHATCTKTIGGETNAIGDEVVDPALQTNAGLSEP